MRTLIISAAEADRLVSMEECIELQRKAFYALGTGRGSNAPNSWLHVNKHSGHVKMLAGYVDLGDEEALAMKVGSTFPANLTKGLPNVLAAIILFDPETCYPIAIMDGIFVTGIRTGAGGGIATEYLARSDSEKLGIIGTGVTSKYTLHALSKTMPRVTQAKVYSRSKENRIGFVKKMSTLTGIDIMPVDDPRIAVKNADIVITGTSNLEPVFFNDWIEPGMHINAMGNKREIDPMIFKRVKTVGDSFETALEDGKASVALSKGIIRKEDVYGDIGEIVAGKKPGRISKEEVTLFDSSGVAVQDAITALQIYKKAREAKVGREIDLYEGIEKYGVG